MVISTLTPRSTGAIRINAEMDERIIRMRKEVPEWMGI